MTKCMNVDKYKLINWMEYLIDNVYIKVGNKVYRQTVGIPMGTDCAPHLSFIVVHYARDCSCTIERACGNATTEFNEAQYD